MNMKTKNLVFVMIAVVILAVLIDLNAPKKTKQSGFEIEVLAGNYLKNIGVKD